MLIEVVWERPHVLQAWELNTSTEFMIFFQFGTNFFMLFGMLVIVSCY